MKYKFGICGPFDFEERGTGGQSVKTREFYYALMESIGKEKIQILESTGYKKNPFLFFLRYVNLLRNSEHTIILPAQNGIKIFAPISVWFKGKGKIHYSVIGGWLPELLRNKPSLKKYLRRFDTILVETNVMKRDLETMGLTNVKRLLNFKRLKPISEIDPEEHRPIRICYFSRVAKEKGIEDAISAVEAVNSEGMQCVFDIYGPIIPEYEDEFASIQKTLPDGIRYCGKIEPEKSIATLRKYDLQLFPTRYPTEGIPGSIVDSYFAGVPVLSAKWNSFSDVVKDGITGIGFEQVNQVDFCNKLKWILNHTGKLEEMKRNCLLEAQQYKPERVIQSFFKMIGEEGI